MEIKKFIKEHRVFIIISAIYFMFSFLYSFDIFIKDLKEFGLDYVLGYIIGGLIIITIFFGIYYLIRKGFSKIKQTYYDNKKRRDN